jgi:hypothetical protein
MTQYFSTYHEKLVYLQELYHLCVSRSAPIRNGPSYLTSHLLQFNVNCVVALTDEDISLY